MDGGILPVIVSVCVTGGSSGLCRVPVIFRTGNTTLCDIWIRWSVPPSYAKLFDFHTQKNPGCCFFGHYSPLSYFLVEFPGAFRHCEN